MHLFVLYSRSTDVDLPNKEFTVVGLGLLTNSSKEPIAAGMSIEALDYFQKLKTDKRKYFTSFIADDLKLFVTCRLPVLEGRARRDEELEYENDFEWLRVNNIFFYPLNTKLKRKFMKAKPGKEYHIKVK